MKGHAVLLEAFERVVAIHPASRLLIAGAGPEEPSIRALIERLGLGSAVTMLGHVDDPLAFLVGLDVHVLPSVTLESLGYSVVEAMHAGVPSVVSDVGGAKEIIGASGGGLIVGARDVEALAAALCQYVEHPEERRQAGERARRYAQEHLTAERMALLTAGVYRKVTGVPQGRRG
jgi:glycosyltransferase involved in cell wall biosynthesis